MLRLLRGWRITIYFVLSTGLAIGLMVMVATSDPSHETPMQNMNTIWPFVCLEIIFCLTIFASDSFSSESGSNTLQLYLLLPQKRLKILISKLVLPIIWFYSGLAIFSIAFVFIPYPTGFWKLWTSMVLIDSLLFFALLSITVFISIGLKGVGATVLVSSLLMFLLFVYPFQTTATFGSFNPFFVGSIVMKDLYDGALDSPMPVVYACLISVFAFALAYYALIRKEVSD